MPAAGRKALFLDRDGVVNVDKGYVFRIEDFDFIDGVFEACAGAQALGYLLVIVSNQSGIAQGHYTEEDYRRLTEWMTGRFAARDIAIAGVYHCPFHPEAAIDRYRRESDWRKPGPGMILQARDDLGLELSASVLVGDKDTDVEAGRCAGVGTNILVRTGQPVEAAAGRADLVLDSLAEVARWLEGGGQASAGVRR